MSSRYKIRLAFSVAVGGLLSISTAATAADLPVKTIAPQAAPAWAFYATPYFWAPSLDGTSTIRGRSLDVDVSFIDMVEHSQIPKDLFGLMGAFEARKDSWSFYTDMAYMRLAADRSGTRARSVNPLVGGTLSASASAKFEMFIGEFGAAYEIFRTGAPVGPRVRRRPSISMAAAGSGGSKPRPASL